MKFSQIGLVSSANDFLFPQGSRDGAAVVVDVDLFHHRIDEIDDVAGGQLSIFVIGITGIDSPVALESCAQPEHKPFDRRYRLLLLEPDDSVQLGSLLLADVLKHPVERGDMTPQMQPLI